MSKSVAIIPICAGSESVAEKHERLGWGKLMIKNLALDLPNELRISSPITDEIIERSVFFNARETASE